MVRVRQSLLLADFMARASHPECQTRGHKTIEDKDPNRTGEDPGIGNKWLPQSQMLKPQYKRCKTDSTPTKRL